jgi:predicted Rdx family selenoprotein
MSVDRLHRAAWVSTELLLTFPPPALTAVTVVPLNSDDTTGRFRVWLESGDGSPILMWDRKVNGGFPELKVLVSRMTTAHAAVFTLLQKQRIRDHIQPGKSLGHSDRKS